jgi:ribosome biogenesis GTPase
LNLKRFGWHPFFEACFAEYAEEGLVPARVVAELRGAYRLATEAGEIDGRLAGKLRHEAEDRAALPAVGDWVAVAPAGAEAAVVRAVLPRRGAFSRKVAGMRVEEQIVAANVDTVFVVVGLDNDFNLRRVERYLALAWESGARPVVALNKVDVCDDPEARAREVEAVAIGVPVVLVSAARGDGLDGLSAHLRAGETVALLGSSGAGKSTLANRLLGGDVQRTGGVREHDSRGRHTTTHRELFVLPSGAILVDTPGMRELQLWGDGGGVAEAFEDVEALARECRFSDCSHASEPGCAVRDAVDPKRLASYRALGREMTALERKRHWKAIHKAMRSHSKR